MMVEVDNKLINSKSIICPACGSKFDYRQFIECEKVILKRYKALITCLKEEWGEVFIAKDTVLLGKIKELEKLYSILIKK